MSLTLGISRLYALAGLSAVSAALTFGCSPGTVAYIPYTSTGGTSGTNGTSGASSTGGTSAGTSGGSSGSTGGTGNTDAGGLSGDDTGDTGVERGGEGGAGGTGGGTSADWGTPVAGGPSGSGTTATVTVDSSDVVGTIGSGYAGFSYEKTHITNDSLNSTNANLIALYKLIGSPPMRLGANDVDVCNWAGQGPSPASPSGQPFTHTITSGMVDELCSFLAATGGKIIYGVNYNSGNVTASAAEAAYAQGKCGSSILGFEIGNEINFDGTWDSIRSEYESFATAILATPGTLIIGPAADAGNQGALAGPYAEDISAKYGSKLTMLTQHYYAGIGGTSGATVASLQGVPPALLGTNTAVNSAAVTYKIPGGYRLGEANTFEAHGQMGVSDTLIAGLWVIDVMFLTAEHGGVGINFHGGETGMDGTRPFYYEPIMEDDGVVVQVQPDYYGMLLFYLVGQGNMLSTSVDTSDKYFTAYAAQTDGFTSVVLVNKSDTGVNATVDLGTSVTSASAIYLQGTPAGSLSAAAGNITLAGAQVAPDGVWNRNAPYIQQTSGNAALVYVPPASAALVRVLQ